MVPLAETLRDQLIESERVIDPKGWHHELVGGMHGRKIDFDEIPDGSDLFDLWVEATAQELRFLYGASHAGKLVLVSVATGTDRLVKPVAERLGGRTVGVLTEKASPGSVILPPEAAEIIREQDPIAAVVLEDVGKTGENAASAVDEVRLTGVEYVDVLVSWQRRQNLEKIRAARSDYYSLIEDYKSFPTYNSAEDCVHCAEGWELIEYGRSV